MVWKKTLDGRLQVFWLYLEEYIHAYMNRKYVRANNSTVIFSQTFLISISQEFKKNYFVMRVDGKDVVRITCNR